MFLLLKLLLLMLRSPSKAGNTALIGGSSAFIVLLSLRFAAIAVCNCVCCSSSLNLDPFVDSIARLLLRCCRCCFG